MGELKTIKLEDEIRLVYGKGLTKNTRIEGEFNVYGSNGVVGTHNEAIFKGPGLIIGRKGTVGSVVLSKDDFYAIDTTYVLELNDPNDDLMFWYYYLKTLGLDQMNSHSAVPGLSRDAVYRKEVKILTDINERKRVAATLSCLDEKIELNNHMNKNLEEMAQAIFKSWFVDFEPFQDGEFEESELGMIPKGWRVESLDQVANYLNGLAMQKYRPESDEYLPVIKIKELNQEQVDSNSDQARVDLPKQYIIENGDIIFSWSGTLLVKIWTGGKGALNQHLFKVTSDRYDKWFYYLWTVYHLEKFRGIASDKATTMGHIKRSHLSEAKVIIPDDRNFEILNGIMQPLLKQIIDIKVQNGTLRDLRDSLLPKLMSGEVRVPIEEVQ